MESLQFVMLMILAEKLRSNGQFKYSFMTIKIKIYINQLFIRVNVVEILYLALFYSIL